MQNPDKVLKLFQKYNALILNTHVVYTSGKHGSTYINKDALYPHTKAISKLCKILAERFAKDGVEIVIAPAVGGVILSQWTAHHLSNVYKKEVLGTYADKGDNGSFVIKRGYNNFIPGKRVLVLEDNLTTGMSVKKVVDEVRKLNGKVVGVGALSNRSGIKKEDLGVPKLFALLNFNFESWEAAECPLCKQNIPLNKDVGKGKTL